MRLRLRNDNGILNFFQRTLIYDKLNSWVGFILIGIIAVGFGYLISNDFIFGAAAVGAVVGITLVLLCILSAEWGLYTILAYAFSASFLSRSLFHDQVPVGVMMDILVFTTFLGLFFSNDKLGQTAKVFFSIKPVVFYSVVLIYLCFELFNPLGHSFEGWIQIMRKVFESFLIVFIAYNVFDSLAKIWRFFKILFFFVLLTALYGCFQQWHGLLSFELTWVHSDPVRLGLIYIFGEYRMFSVFAGPTEFGIIMQVCSLLFLLISLTLRNSAFKWVLIVGSIIMLLAMSYSGTRTANAMLIGGIVMFILITFNKKQSKIFAVGAILVFLFLMYVPIYSSVALMRFRSTFSASEDASFNVREMNRERVQPFIYSHPFGGGVYTTGEMGEKYNPGHPLAGFPTDSSYLNKALETGWVGLILTLLFYFSTLVFIIRSYFSTSNSRIKGLLAAFAAFFFSFYIGEITQEAVGLFSNMAVFFPALAIVFRLSELANQKPRSSFNVSDE